MRVLHVVGGLANTSGTTRIILRLSEQLVVAGHSAAILYLTNRGFDTVRPRDARVELIECPVTCLPRWGYASGLRTQLRALIPRFDVIHVHSTWLYPNLAVWWEARGKIPYVVAPQGALDGWSLSHHAFRKRLYAVVIERRILNAAAAIQAVSPHEAASVRAFGVRAPVVVVGNGADLEGYACLPDKGSARKTFGLSDDAGVILYLGRLFEKKGIDVLIKAFGAFSGERPDARLLIAGDDCGTGYRRVLDDHVAALGLEDKVVFTGELQEGAKREAFAAADLFVLASRSEGQPVAALEAMAAGLPLVLSEHCRIPEAGEAGAGLVVAGDATSVLEAMRRLCTDAPLLTRMGLQARQLAKDRFDWRRITQEMLALYERVVADQCASVQMHQRIPVEPDLFRLP